MKRPSFQFYPADWRKDPALAPCSLAARGLWIEMMCIAHESDSYGTLSVNGKALTAAQLARMVGESPRLVDKLLAELEEAGVFSRNENGAIFSRRMVKDEAIRNVRAEAGRQGGNPNLVKPKVGDLVKQKDKQTAKQNPTPSSSSSSSSSDAVPKAGVSVVPLRPEQQQLGTGAGRAESPSPDQPGFDPTAFAKAVAEIYGEVYGMDPPPVPLMVAMGIAQRAEFYEPCGRLDWWRRYFTSCRDDLFLTDRKSLEEPHGPKAAGFNYLVSEKCISSMVERSRREAGHG